MNILLISLVLYSITSSDVIFFLKKIFSSSDAIYDYVHQ
jgi:hypothetical protein